jgi:hypothetical protein
MGRTARCYLLGPCKPQLLLLSVTCSRLAHQQLISNSSAESASGLADEFVHGGDGTWPGSCKFPHPLATPSPAGRSVIETTPATNGRRAYSPPPSRPRPSASGSTEGSLPPLRRCRPMPWTRARRRRCSATMSPRCGGRPGSSASRLVLPDGQAYREAHPAHLRQHPFAALDADQIGAWRARLVADGLKPATVNSYVSLLGRILNAAVDSDYLPHSPSCGRAAPAGSPQRRTSRAPT